MYLSGPKRDLDIAASEIEKMKQTRSFSEFQEGWENFLFRIEHAWELTERTLRGNGGFERWHKPYTDLRKKDPLLVFLKQARNSEMHSICSTVSKSLKMKVSDKTGRGINISSISSGVDKGVLTVSIETPDLLPDVSADIVPTDPKLSRIKNRGKWYNPPWSHLKERINDLHPVSVAELGYSFYRGYVSEAEAWLERS